MLKTLPDNLKQALKNAKAFMPPRTNSLPVLECVHLSTEGGFLVIEATNLDTFYEVKVGAMVETDIDLLVNYKKLAGVINAIKSSKKATDADAISMFVEQKDKITSLVIKDARGYVSRIQTGPDVQEFPIPMPLAGKQFHIWQPDQFIEAVKALYPATSDDGSRPTLTGIFVENKEFAASDGFRLHIAKVKQLPDDDTVPMEQPMLIPGKALYDMAKQLDPAYSFATRYAGSDKLYVNFYQPATQQSWTIHLIDNKFPDFTAVIPKATNFDFRIRHDEFLAAIKALKPIANDALDTMRLFIYRNQYDQYVAKLVARTDEQVGDRDLRVTVDNERRKHWQMDEPAAFYFNCNYMQDAIEALYRPDKAKKTVGYDEVKFRTTAFGCYKGSYLVDHKYIRFSNKPVMLKTEKVPVDALVMLMYPDGSDWVEWFKENYPIERDPDYDKVRAAPLPTYHVYTLTNLPAHEKRIVSLIYNWSTNVQGVEDITIDLKRESDKLDADDDNKVADVVYCHTLKDIGVFGDRFSMLHTWGAKVKIICDEVLDTQSWHYIDEKPGEMQTPEVIEPHSKLSATEPEPEPEPAITPDEPRTLHIYTWNGEVMEYSHSEIYTNREFYDIAPKCSVICETLSAVTDVEDNTKTIENDIGYIWIGSRIKFVTEPVPQPEPAPADDPATRLRNEIESRFPNMKAHLVVAGIAPIKDETLEPSATPAQPVSDEPVAAPTPDEEEIDMNTASQLQAQIEAQNKQIAELMAMLKKQPASKSKAVTPKESKPAEKREKNPLTVAAKSYVIGDPCPWCGNEFESVTPHKNPERADTYTVHFAGCTHSKNVKAEDALSFLANTAEPTEDEAEGFDPVAEHEKADAELIAVMA